MIGENAAKEQETGGDLKAFLESFRDASASHPRMPGRMHAVVGATARFRIWTMA